MKSFYFTLILLTFLTYSQKSKDNAPLAKVTSFELRLSNAALSIINPNVVYDPSYFTIAYPNGDIPKNKGV